MKWTPSAETRIADAELGRMLWAQALNRGALSVAGQLVGLAQRMLDLSVDYVAQRKQFGKPIGSFQAVKHHLADVATQIEFAKPVLYRAAHALARARRMSTCGSPRPPACCEASWLAARHGIQVHGAMGYTWEVDLQMFMKRAWALDNAWGDRACTKPASTSICSVPRCCPAALSRNKPCLKPILLTRCARPPASARAACPCACHRHGRACAQGLVERNSIPADEYDDVIFGCVDTIGSQAADIARTSWLAAGLPLCVPGTTVDRQCGSSQQALHFAARR